MATITLRASNGVGSSWNNIPNTYDSNTSTSGTVSVSLFNYSSRTLTHEFDLSSIPTGSTILNATLHVFLKASANSRVTLYADINGSSSYRVINKSVSNTDSLFSSNDIASHLNSLTNIKFTAYSTSISSTTVTVYDVRIEIEYEEPIVNPALPVFLGDNQIQSIYLGNSPIEKIYIGDTQIY